MGIISGLHNQNMHMMPFTSNIDALLGFKQGNYVLCLGPFLVFTASSATNLMDACGKQTVLILNDFIKYMFFSMNANNLLAWHSKSFLKNTDYITYAVAPN